ncbi:conserved hypothetical protein [Beggiatoa sp. PS]|nr:conserved hypothetical protein [Beggiatoa sp. PS]
MPIYEYACTDCGHELEILQKMNDLLLEQCPACGQNTLKKQISAVAFHLKGTGWYETDFKGKKKPTESEKTTTQKTEAKKTETKKTDTSKTDTSTKSSSGTATSPTNTSH